MKFLITGATGFIGNHLVTDLLNNQHEVYVFTRRPTVAKQHFDKAHIITDLTELSDDTKLDVIINLAGSNIAGFWWTKQRKQDLVNSRVKTTQKIVSLVNRLITKPKLIINASAVGWYGTISGEQITEESLHAAGFTHELCQQWEDAILTLKNITKVHIIRLGVVLGRQGGMFKPLWLSSQLAFGAIIGSGQQIFSWIHIKDVIQAINFLIEQQLPTTVFNLTAPTLTTQKHFITSLSKRLHRPVWLHLPAWLIKISLGEMGEELLLNGSKIYPKNLLDHGFKFKFPLLEDALEDLLK